MSEEERWSGWNCVEEQVQQINQGELKKPKRGIKRQEWDVRQDSTNNEAILRKMCV